MSLTIFDVMDRCTPGVGQRFSKTLKPADGLGLVQVWTPPGEIRPRVWRVSILIQLHPEVPQCIWTFVVVHDFFGAIHTVHFRIKPDMNDVIGSVLPVQMSRGSTRGSVGVGSGQVVFQLSEQVRLTKLFWSQIGPVGHGRQ